MEACNEVLDACDAVLQVYRRLSTTTAGDKVIGCVALEAVLDQLAAAVRNTRQQARRSTGEPGE